MAHKFNALTVDKVVKETEDSLSIFFIISQKLKNQYDYHAGQYLTLTFTINEREERRAYSICTGPHEEGLGINVKRVKNGKVSNFIHETVRAGDSLQVMVPDGNFTLETREGRARDLYFFASGSGITPVISLIKTFLEEEPISKCYLLYGNKDETSIIFNEEVEKLTNRYEGQLFVRHTLSQPKREKQKGFKGMLSQGRINWTGWKGRIDGRKISQFLSEYPQQGKEAHYFVCGPGAMIDTIIDYLEGLDIPKDKLHSEHFISSNAPSTVVSGGITSQVTVHLSGKTFIIGVPPEKTILDVLIDEKYDPPYSCTSGACSTCVAKLISGKVEMDACYALDDNEISDGLILTCQSRAHTEKVELSFDT